MSISSQFIRSFDPKNESHVKWFKKVTELAENELSTSKNVTVEINKNPMGVVMGPQQVLDWAEIHFALCARYCMAVFKNQAWIPHSGQTNN